MTSDGPTLRTPRLVLRPWRDDDVGPFAAMNADPRVMEHFPAPLTLEETKGMVERTRAHFARHGFGVWALERASDGALLGFAGLSRPTWETPIPACTEVGWRLAAEHWGRGYATEGAQEAARFAFETLALDELVSFTVPGNLRSRRVMERLGMTHDPRDDFEHPKVPVCHALRPHVLYRLPRARWVRQ